MTPKILPLLERCIEEGIELGWRRAHKHTDAPTELMIRSHINEAIWLTIHEWFDIESPPS